jgi:AraC family transcriptional activator of pobA
MTPAPRFGSAEGRAPAVRQIAFDRHKYALPLQVDACSVGSIPGFIKTPEPHRLGFYEVVLVTAGRGHLELDGSALEVAPYRLCLTRPGETRSWQVEDGKLEGLLAFFETAFLDDFFADPGFVEGLPAMTCAASRRSIPLSRDRFDGLMALVGEMTDELRSPRGDSGHLLRAHVYRMLVMLQRASGVTKTRELDRAARLAARFTALVASKARLGDKVADYAEALGTTTRTLNRALQRSFGRSAGELIQQHVLLQSRRLLACSDLSVAAIAERLHFADASYFSRFFSRHLGMPPGRFRQEHESAAAVRNVHCEVEPDR